jgi:imidazolonepropionase-like amidohydrolase
MECKLLARHSTYVILAISLLCAGVDDSQSQPASNLPQEVREYVICADAVVVLSHVKVIDGTGKPPRPDQTLIIRDGKIASVGDTSATPAPAGARVFNLDGHSVIPGLVGMHEHLFYTSALDRDADGKPVPHLSETAFTAPRLYLAAGVTTIRTTGSIEPYTDLDIRKQIDAKRMVGPKMDVTSPYLEGSPRRFPQMHELTGPDDARRMVAFWADAGMTSFKAYTHITHAELGAAIKEVHKHHLRLTAHLCSIGWREAAALGIDDFAHGPTGTDSEFVIGKQPDQCPSSAAIWDSWVKMQISSAPVKQLIRDLVDRGISVTSTIANTETITLGRPDPQQRVLDVLSPESRASYIAQRARGPVVASAPDQQMKFVFEREMQFEYAFLKAGGMLMAGSDPTGIGGTVPGFANQREVELLVEAGFTPLEAIHIATYNGARYLGELDHIGTIAPGKQADLVVVKGDPSSQISDIEAVEMVFKDGVGYDPVKLLDSVRGIVGLR